MDERGGARGRAVPRRLYWIAIHVVVVLAFARNLAAPFVDRDELVATDFTVFYTGWSLVLHDPANTYDVEAQRRVQAEIMRGRHFEGGVMTFYYPPHAALAFAPLAALPFEAAFAVWTLAQVACLVLLVRRAWTLAGLSAPLAPIDRWVLATAVAAFLPVLYTLQIGQLSIAMTLALVVFWEAFERRRDALAGAALLALTVKPQLLVVPLLLLLASRRWRAFAWSCAWGAPLVLASVARLGPRSWIDYPAHVRRLEGFVAGGSHDFMLNVRGTLTRLFGSQRERPIVGVSAVVFVAACAAIYVLFRRAARRGPVGAEAYAAGLALGLPVALHLHLQDAVAWVAPLVMFAGVLGVSRSAERPAARRFAWFALAWPTAYVLTAAVESAVGRRIPVPPALVLATVLIVWTWRHSFGGGPGIITTHSSSA